ncbi:alpha/beta hydrolase fold domain-containing protein [Parasediminibacterium sp. JCM 36343]|uniref:alpha/beta hydrolase fold domain-containing protein n=1 Tax=Parasediminibacterium sp. JCM 36343 TaxID=3374279 RepID=UPI00397B330F
MKLILPIVLLTINIGLCLAQGLVVPKDTSFTVASTYLKEQKRRPYIVVAAPKKSKTTIAQLDIPYKHIGQRELLLDVFYPKNTKHQKPAVLLVFGGGWRSGDKTQNHAMAVELANKGYVAVSAEYRLSPEAIYPAAVLDLKDVIKWMRANAMQYGIDTNKIAILGCSAGGQLAALIGTTNCNPKFEDTSSTQLVSSKVQAVVDIDGILAFHHPESAEGAVAAQWLGGTYAQQPEKWEDASALSHLDKRTVPFLFINSATARFHAGRDSMMKQMSTLGIYSEAQTIDDTPHPFWFFHPWFQPMMGYVVAFLEKQFQ